MVTLKKAHKHLLTLPFLMCEFTSIQHRESIANLWQTAGQMVWATHSITRYPIVNLNESNDSLMIYARIACPRRKAMRVQASGWTQFVVLLVLMRRVEGTKQRALNQCARYTTKVLRFWS